MASTTPQQLLADRHVMSSLWHIRFHNTNDYSWGCMSLGSWRTLAETHLRLLFVMTGRYCSCTETAVSRYVQPGVGRYDLEALDCACINMTLLHSYSGACSMAYQGATLNNWKYKRYTHHLFPGCTTISICSKSCPFYLSTQSWGLSVHLPRFTARS